MALWSRHPPVVTIGGTSFGCSATARRAWRFEVAAASKGRAVFHAPFRIGMRRSASPRAPRQIIDLPTGSFLDQLRALGDAHALLGQFRAAKPRLPICVPILADETYRYRPRPSSRSCHAFTGRRTGLSAAEPEPGRQTRGAFALYTCLRSPVPDLERQLLLQILIRSSRRSW